MNQSPIKLQSSTALQLACPTDLLTISYPEQQGYTGQFDEDGNLVLGPDAPCVAFRGRSFQLKKVHIHQKTEHIVDADHEGDFEIHFVHAPKGGSLSDSKLVIGIIYRKSNDAKTQHLFAEFAKGLPSRTELTERGSHEGKVEHQIWPAHFFPLSQAGETHDFENWFHYEGSLTGFPFSEDVSWFVMRREALVNPADTNELEQYAEHHARELQPLNRRLVVKSFA